MNRNACVKCGQALQSGEFYVEVQQVVERDGMAVITRGDSFMLAHLKCPPAEPCYHAPNTVACGKCGYELKVTAVPCTDEADQ